MRALLVLSLLLAAAPAFADDLSGDAPEPPLPQPPAVMPLASTGPVVLGPDTHELLTEQCKDQDFGACFKNWRPPPPPPEPEKKEAKAAEPPAQLPPGAPREPAVGGPLVGPPPTPQPEADQATYDALVKAMKEAGLDGKVLMPDPPQDGGTIMQLAPATAADPKRKAAPPSSPR